jgi:hypothetical protein
MVLWVRGLGYPHRVLVTRAGTLKAGLEKRTVFTAKTKLIALAISAILVLSLGKESDCYL